MCVCVCVCVWGNSLPPLQERTVEKDNAQGSLPGLLGAVAFVFILANFAKVFGYVQGLVAAAPKGSASPSMARRR